MSGLTFIDLWIDRYDSLDEEGRVSFLLGLKREWKMMGSEDAGNAFMILCNRWMIEDLA